MEEFSRHSLLSNNQYLKIDRSIVSNCSSRKRKSENFDIEDQTEEEKSEITVKTEKDVSNYKKDYIHVRARRGQATDSHSLAERARREKISKKMKCLQDLVPGCNKVTGKAGMLDEIINYVQSLQKQVEILSLKLATFSPRLDDNFFAKETIKPSAYVGRLPSQAAEPTNSNSFHCNIMQQLGSLASISDHPPQKLQSPSHFLMLPTCRYWVGN